MCLDSKLELKLIRMEPSGERFLETDTSVAQSYSVIFLQIAPTSSVSCMLVLSGGCSLFSWWLQRF